MAENSILNERAWKIESLLSEESDYRRKPISLTQEDTQKLHAYLKNPTSCGVWVLEGVFLGSQGITEEIVEDVIALEKSSEKPTEKSPDEIKGSVIRSFANMNSLFGLFGYMNCTEPKDRKRYITDLNSDAQLIIESMDTQKYQKKYQKDLQFFKDYIWDGPLRPKLDWDTFTYLKSGLILFGPIVQTNNGIRPLKVFSLKPEPLEKLETFLLGIKKISDSIIYPMYSPEEDVFEPYCSILKLSFEKLFKGNKIRDLLGQSISIFDSQNYAYCISTIGLVLEEQLTQIYETLLRDKCPQGLTLGELVDLINKEVKNRFVVDIKKDNKPNADDIYKRINNSLINCQSNSMTNNDELLVLIRDVLTFTKESNLNVLSKLKSSHKAEFPSVFPNNIRLGMEELIRYRNSISHKSRTPVGSFEAIKSIFHITSLVMWWSEAKKTINWNEQPDNIVRQMVKDNNPTLMV